MVYDDNQKKWIPSGSSSGLSKVHIYHHQQNNTFRVVGRKLQDHEVVINCSILKGLKYNQATPTFHQWRDSKFVYGLNFSSQQDAEAFARAMLHALEVSLRDSARRCHRSVCCSAGRYVCFKLCCLRSFHLGIERPCDTTKCTTTTKWHNRLRRRYGLSDDDTRRCSDDTTDQHTRNRPYANHTATTK